VTVNPQVSRTAGELGSRPVSIVSPNSRKTCKSAASARTGSMEESGDVIVGIDVSDAWLDVHVLSIER
jgi:hypothetical protein